MPKPPHFFQTYPFSCVPACLRMVLASLDFKISELELRNLCKCDDWTISSNAVNAAIECGFDADEVNLTFEELEDLIRQNIAPIVFTKVSENANYSHAVVVYKISNEKVFVLDPAIGELKIDRNKFVEIWLRGLTIVVEKAI